MVSGNLNPNSENEEEFVDDLTELEEREAKEADRIYSDLARDYPQREVVMPEGVGVRTPKSMEEEEETGSSDSDFERFLRKLFPTFPYRKLKVVCAAVMVGRVLYDSMLDRVNLTFSSIVEDWEERPVAEGGDGELNVQLLLDLITVAYEIGLDSKGRVDIQEGLGAAESRKLNDVASQLG